jgi:hypothetical protein
MCVSTIYVMLILPLAYPLNITKDIFHYYSIIAPWLPQYSLSLSQGFIKFHYIHQSINYIPINTYYYINHPVFRIVREILYPCFIPKTWSMISCHYPILTVYSILYYPIWVSWETDKLSRWVVYHGIYRIITAFITSYDYPIIFIIPYILNELLFPEITIWYDSLSNWNQSLSP